MKKSPLQLKNIETLAPYGLNPKCLAGVWEILFEPGETALRQGETMKSLFVVTAGTAKVCINARNGKSLILCYYVSRGILGDVELTREERSATTTVIATSPLRVIAIPIAENEAYLRENIVFMNSIAGSLSEKLVNSSAAHAASALYTSEERLCSYILMTERDGVFTDVLTEAAQSVGMSYRHVFRVINVLLGEGILEKSARGYKILDRDALRRISAE